MNGRRLRSLLTVGFVAVALVGTGFIYVGCNRTTSSELNEVAQQLGDLMASLDESSGANNGTVTTLEGANRTFARLTNDKFPDLFSMKEAHAASCDSTSTFGTCSGGVIQRDFQDCTISSATFSGTVDLQFSDGSCSMATQGDTVTRIPNFTVSGLRGATLTVALASAGGVGQIVTRGSGNNFTLSSDGIRRTFALGSNTLIDFTTETTSDVTLSGTSRADRVIDGGTVRVTNNLSGVSCDVSPTAVTWESTCNCATSGSFSGTCSDGKTSTLTITGCGTASLTMGSTTQTFTFDRCYDT